MDRLHYYEVLQLQLDGIHAQTPRIEEERRKEADLLRSTRWPAIQSWLAERQDAFQASHPEEAA